MARRDVDLVIRARDEARGALGTINQALNQFVEAQREVRDSAAGTDSALDRLGRSFAELRGMVGTGIAGRISQEFERQREAVTRLERELRDTTAAQERLTQEQQEASQATRRYTQEQERASGLVDRQAARVKRLETEYTRLNRSLGRAPAETQRFTQAQERLREQIRKGEERLAAQEDRARRLRAQFAASIPVTRQQARAYARLGRALDRQNATIANTVGRLQELGQRLDGTVADTERFTAAVNRQRTARGDLSQRIRAETQSLDRLRTGLRQADGALETAVQNERRLGAEARKTGNSVEQLTQRLSRAQGELKETGAAAAQAGAQLATTARAARNAVNQLQIREGASGNLAALGQRVRALRAEIDRLGGQASPKLRQELELAMRAFREQLQVTRQVREAARNAGVGYSALGRAARSAEDDLRATEAAMRRIRGVTGQTQQRLRQTAREFDRTGRSARRASVQAREFSRAIRPGAGGRQALTLLQRIRSEVIALTTAYVGLFGVFRGIGGVINALRTVQGAQSRLGALFEGDLVQVGEEIDFIRRQADRLGIQFGVLSEAYTKFAIATQGTNIEGEETRRIFVKVAEAARVNNLTTANLVAVFRALEQIANKGVFQMEELRQQLGDRLPGAINILAAGLGVSTEVLSDLLERGEIGAERLAEFADELERRFGKQLPASLQLSEAAIGRFQNEIFETQRTIAEGDFQIGFIDLLNRLADVLGSGRFQSFAEGLSSALAFLAEVIATVAENWRALVIAGSALIGLKLAPLILALAARFRTLGIAVAGAITGVRGLTGAFRGLLSATGIGLIFSVIGAGLGAWATSIDDATAAIQKHQRVVDTLRGSWDSLIGKPEEYSRVTDLRTAAAAEGITQATLESQLAEAREARERVIADIIALVSGDAGFTVFEDQFRGLSQNVDDFLDSMIDLIARLDTGQISFTDFSTEVDHLYRVFEGDEQVRAAASTILELARNGDESARRIRELTQALTILIGDSEEAAAAADALLNTEESLQKQREISIRQARSSLKEVSALESQAATLAQRYFDQVSRGAAQGVIQETAGQWSQVVDQLEEARQRSLELFTSILGGLDQTNPLLRTTVAEIEDIIANLENALALGEQEAATPFAEFYAQRFQFLRDEARKVLDDIGREEELGLAPDLGSFERAQRLIEGAVERARQAVAVYESIPDRTEQIQARIDELNRFIATSTEELRSFLLQRTQTQISQVESLISALEEQRRIQLLSGELAAAADSTGQLELARSELQGLRELALTIIDTFEFASAAVQQLRNQLEEGVRTASTDQLRADLADQEARIQQLLTLRGALQDIPLTSFSQFGQVAGDLDTVNGELAEAIDKALEMARALAASDPAAAAVVARLEQLRATAGSAANEIGITFRQLSDLASQGAVRLFDEWAQAIVDGENAIESLGNAFRRFASEFLRQIARMIIQQAVFNALQGAGSGGGLLGFLFHAGGDVDRSGPARMVNPAVYANAFRYQMGGFAGFAPNEVPAILHTGEYVATEDDPLHPANQRGGQGDLTVVNAIDGPSFLEAGLDDRRGQRTFMNFVRANRRNIRTALGIT